MTVTEDTFAIRNELANLRLHPDLKLLITYDLLAQGKPKYIFKILNKISVFLSSFRHTQAILTKYKWNPSLKHGKKINEGRILLIWGCGIEKKKLRDCCEGLFKLINESNFFIPVLVTDIADFSYFSRLGWLIEYLPEISGDGHSYQKRKKNYLAWRYKEAVIVYATVGLLSKAEFTELTRDKLRNG